MRAISSHWAANSGDAALVNAMRESGVHDVLVYCRDHRCTHHIAISADR